MNEAREPFFADSALADSEDGRIDDRLTRREADEFSHRGAVHTQTAFAIGNEPAWVCVWHRPLNDTGRHLTEANGCSTAAVRVSSLPEDLFESELFGHARGAFTGAIQGRPRLFEAAHGGTLLLDEVGEVPLPLQVKLLRALQEHEIRRLGENRQRRFDVRLIAATNRNLAQAVKERRFREDLYYRLNVVELPIPPLRDRPEDLRALADSILLRVARRMGRPDLRLLARRSPTDAAIPVAGPHS